MSIINYWTTESLVCLPDSDDANAINDAVFTEVDTAVSGNVLDNDIICIAPWLTRVSLTGTELNCSVTAFDMTTGAFTVLPDAAFTGEARFTYNIECDKMDGFGYVVQDTGLVEVFVNPTAAAEIGSITLPSGQSQIFIDPGSSVAWYYRVRIDIGNNASVDFTSAIIPNLDPDNPLTTILVNQDLNNGDLIYLDSSNDAAFSSFASDTWIVPDTGTNTIDDTTDLTAVDYTLQGVLDPATTERNFRVEARDYVLDTLYGEFLVTGVSDNPSGTVDLDALGIDYSVRFSFTVYPYDEIGEAPTPAVVVQDIIPESEQMTVTVLNTFPSDLNKLPFNNNLIRVIVNGITYFINDTPQPWSISGQTLTWLSPDGFDLEIGQVVDIFYWTLDNN